MFPPALFPPAVFPAAAFAAPGAALGSQAGPGAWQGGLFPGPLFPGAIFPQSMYPGTALGAGSISPLDIRSAIYKSLASDAAVTAIVGPRVYPTFLPQTGKHPCVVFTVISDVRVKGLSGTIGAATARVQFDLRAYRLSDAVALKEALRAKWEGGFRGTMQGLEILWTWPVSEHDFARDPQDASDDRPVVIEVDYFFKYRQSLIPSPTG